SWHFGLTELAKYQNAQLTISEITDHLLLAACLESYGIAGGTWDYAHVVVSKRCGSERVILVKKYCLS
ncbi:MAG: hypothetical protein ACRD4W_05040, partial [Nitrososphaeraceae archaeon]